MFTMAEDETEELTEAVSVALDWLEEAAVVSAAAVVTQCLLQRFCSFSLSYSLSSTAGSGSSISTCAAASIELLPLSESLAMLADHSTSS